MTEHQKRITKKALLIIEQQELKFLKSESENFEPSETYHQNMERLIQQEKQWRNKLIKTKKYKLLTILVAVLLIFSLTFSISAIREPIVEYVVKTYNTYTHLFFKNNGSPSDKIETKYTLNWIPEDYHLSSSTATASHSQYLWKHENQYISFNQNLLSTTSIHLNTEQNHFSTIQLNDQTYYHKHTNNVYSFLWINENYIFTLSCSEDIGWENILKILENIKPVET